MQCSTKDIFFKFFLMPVFFPAINVAGLNSPENPFINFDLKKQTDSSTAIIKRTIPVIKITLHHKALRFSGVVQACPYQCQHISSSISHHEKR
jgi:hypothetical protein